MVEGTANGSRLELRLNPTALRGHWLSVDKDMLKTTKAQAGDTMTLEIEVSREWPEPQLPEDLKEALENRKGKQDMARQLRQHIGTGYARYARQRTLKRARRGPRPHAPSSVRGVKALLFQSQFVYVSRDLEQWRASRRVRVSRGAARQHVQGMICRQS